MKHAIRHALATSLAASLLLVSEPGTGAGAQSAARATVPDLSGMWGRNSLDFEAPASGPGPVFNLARHADGSPDINTLVGDYNNPILKPATAEQLKRKGEDSLHGIVFADPHNACWPDPVPFGLYNFQIQILQQPNEVILLYMEDHEVRHVRMNAAHPAKIAPSWTGDSVGSYEGDTVGLKVGPLAYVDQYGTPYSENLHVVERYRLIDANLARETMARHGKDHGRIGPNFEGALIDENYPGKALQIEFTVEDSGVFTTPWSARVTYRRAANAWEERVCAENWHEYFANRDTTIPVATTPDF
jgi:hypothetical protein